MMRSCTHLIVLPILVVTAQTQWPEFVGSTIRSVAFPLNSDNGNIIVGNLYDGCHWYDYTGHNSSETEASTPLYHEHNDDVCVVALLGHMLEAMITTSDRYAAKATCGRSQLQEASTRWHTTCFSVEASERILTSATNGIHSVVHFSNSTLCRLDHLQINLAHFQLAQVFGLMVVSERIGDRSLPSIGPDILAFARDFAGDTAHKYSASFRTSDTWAFCICAAGTNQMLYRGKIVLEGYYEEGMLLDSPDSTPEGCL